MTPAKVFCVRLGDEDRAVLERAAAKLPKRYGRERKLGELLRSAALVIARRLLREPAATGWAHELEQRITDELEQRITRRRRQIAPGRASSGQASPARRNTRAIAHRGRT